MRAKNRPARTPALPDHNNSDPAHQLLTTTKIVPRGLSRFQAAAYVGVSPTLFDQMVADGRMPSPQSINSRTVWDRLRIDEAFDELPDRDHGNPWDEDT